MTTLADKFIIESFWQLDDANCATIAILKAAIIRFGLWQVFELSEYSSDKMLITLRNGKQVKVSFEEIYDINQESGIVYEDYHRLDDRKRLAGLRFYVECCFAVIIKNMSRNGFCGKRYSVEKAIDKLVGWGINSDDACQLLGLSRSRVHDLMEKDMSGLKTKRAVMLYNNHHAVMLSDGYWDDYGDAARLSGKIPKLNGHDAKFWYALR